VTCNRSGSPAKTNQLGKIIVDSVTLIRYTVGTVKNCESGRSARIIAVLLLAANKTGGRLSVIELPVSLEYASIWDPLIIETVPSRVSIKGILEKSQTVLAPKWSDPLG
jgi:hypothetical protein